MTALIALFSGTIAKIGLGIAALAAIWFGGRMSGKSAVKIDKLKDEVKSHDRINKADTGESLSDSARIERLRGFAKRHGD